MLNEGSMTDQINEFERKVYKINTLDHMKGEKTDRIKVNEYFAAYSKGMSHTKLASKNLMRPPESRFREMLIE